MKKTFKAFVLMTFTLMIAAITVFGASASAPIPGDVNGDGRVTVADSVAILLYITGKNTNIAQPCYHKGTVVIDEAVERTCTVDGKSAGVHCTACGEVLLEQIISPAPGHTEAVIPAKPATCTESGLTEGKSCSVCNTILIFQNNVDALGHTESDWIVDKEPTFIEQGVKHTECTVCQTKIKEDSIPVKILEGLAYTVNEDGTTCTVTGIGNYPNNDVVIPEKLDGYTVTAIGDKAFAEQTQITSFFISNTVKDIGRRAFYGCSGITEITIPESVTNIGTQVFQKATNLKTVYYNSHYSSEDNPFMNDTPIETIVFGGNSVPRYVINKDTYTPSVIIGDTVETIEPAAFRECYNLKSVVIGNNVTVIGSAAFCYCVNLTTVSIGNKVESISSVAFEGCSSLESINIPDSVTSIAAAAFNKCKGLTTVTMGNNVTIINHDAFNYCTNLKTVTLSNRIETIKENAFYYCSKLESIIIPDSVTVIGKSAFYGCSNLKNVTVGKGIKTFEYYAFGDCENIENVYITDMDAWCNIEFKDSYSNPTYYAKNFYLNNELVTNVEIPSGVKSICSGMFHNCESLQSIILPESVTSIGDYAFYGCSNLTNIFIPDSVMSIGIYTFYGCSNITSITIPDSVTSIGQYLFSGCTSLTNITIPDSVTSIGERAFYNCTSLTSIDIPASVKSIGWTAFDGTSLTNVTFKGTIAQWESISKNPYWKDSSAIVFIQCTDGYIMSGSDNISSTVPIHEHVFNKQYRFDGKSALFFGDSITYGWVNSTVGKTSNPYPQLFSEKVGLTHTNHGVSGATLGCTVTGRSNILDIIKSKELNADYLFIAGGVNDWAIGTPLNTFKEGVENLCSYLASNYQGEVIFITPIDQAGYPLGNVPVAELQTYRDIITILAVKYGFNVVQGNLLGFPDESGDPSLISSLFADKLHPTEYGYQFYAEQLTKVFGIE